MINIQGSAADLMEKKGSDNKQKLKESLTCPMKDSRTV